jgi:hypothetical protein
MFHCNHCNFPTQHNNLNTISCACIPTHNNVQQPYYYFLCMYLYTKKYFHIGNRKGNIALCQIRTEASNLNLHLYDHHLTDRINCPNCDCPCETPAHFFIHCPEYNNQRLTLKNTFTKLNINFNLQTILNGCETLNYHQNEELVLDIQLFIKNSQRF